MIATRSKAMAFESMHRADRHGAEQKQNPIGVSGSAW
jgi:hypothetical protein